jgi:hypothetical protein
MSDRKRLQLSTQIKNLKHSFLQLSNFPLSNVFSTHWLNKLAESVPYRRDTIYTPLVVLRLFLLQVLNDDRSCKAAVSRFLIERAGEGGTEISHNSGPYCTARTRLPLTLLEDGVRETAIKENQTKNDWKWHGYNVYMGDGTTVLLPDTEDNQKEFPQQKNQKPGLGFPIVRICTLISLATGSVVNYAYARYEGKGTGETSLFSNLQGSLKEGDLLLADRYYATFAIIMLLSIAGVHVVMRSHARRKIDYGKGIRLGKNDHLVKWSKPAKKPPWMSKEEYDELPSTMTVREFRVNGKDFVTTLTDSKQFHKKEMSSLYQQRWNIEVDLRSIKTHMGMEMLSCLSPEMIKKEIAIYFMAYNLIRSIISQSAVIHEKIPRQISFKGAAQLIVVGATTLIGMASRCITGMVNTILLAISTNAVGIRNQTPQPRAIKRRPKPYPLLTKPRREAVIDLANQYVT